MFELASDQWIDKLIEKDTIIPALAIVFGCTAGIVAIVFTTLAGVAKSKAREATRREIAAYVAEGSIAPQDAVALLDAAKDASELEDLAEYHKSMKS